MPENENSSPTLVTPARLVAAVCVIAPFVAVLAVPVFNKRTPEVAGFPFFFWWQLLWVVLTATLMALAYVVVRREELARKAVAASAAIPAQAPAPVGESSVIPDDTETAGTTQNAENTENTENTKNAEDVENTENAAQNAQNEEAGE